jgi:hypothetical protein
VIRPDRYTLPGAREARKVLLAELRRHGYERLAMQYADGKIREKGVMSRLGCDSIELEARGDAYAAKVARGVAMLAAFLHEGKHTRVASADALRAFWAHYRRVHPR